ncbi:Arm DNA-binding domain-containing protein, partial [Phocaeicola dorei]
MKADNNTKNREIKHRSTFAILFYINRTKVRKDGTCQLLCKVSIDAVPAQIGTKASVKSALWNPEMGRADGRSENALTVNRAIDDLTKQIKEHYKRIKNSLGFVTAELVKNAVTGIGQKPLTLLELFREHNEEVKARVGTDCVEETYKIYVRSHNHLQSFI